MQVGVSDLEQVLQCVITRRSNFAHIDDYELNNRQHFLREIRAEVDRMRNFLSSSIATGKVERYKKQSSPQSTSNNLSSRCDDTNNLSTKNNLTINHQQKQIFMEKEQDHYLDLLNEGATRLGHVAFTIKGEVVEQNAMLDGFQNDLDSTSSRMEQVLDRVDRLLKTDSRCQTCTILILVFILIVLVILVSCL